MILIVKIVPAMDYNITISAGAIVFGGIHIGDRSVIDFYAVITKYIPSNEIWAGIPAKCIRKQ